MTLRELARNALGIRAPLPKVQVTGISQDHRKVRPGHVFVARLGAKVDGHRYARLAIEQGAVAVVGVRDTGPTLPWHATPYLRVADDRSAVAKLAAAFHGHPSRRLTAIGVTGTDGKTTVSFLLHHLLSGRYRTGLISTAAVRCHDIPLPLEGHFTTPEATEVQAYLAAFVGADCSHAVLESSSHALAMRRLDEVDYDVAAWTNLSAEHLDYHGTLEEYRAAKLELVRRSGIVVLNRDDEHFTHFSAAAPGRVVTYGLHPEAQWRARSIDVSANGLQFELLAEGTRYQVRLPMLGPFNVHNALAALAAACAADVEEGCSSLPELIERLASFPGVPGRMQMVHAGEFSVVVDFAHTAPALEKALAALRPSVAGRILLVIGAAGERDPGKRRPLGRAAGEGAELIFFTEEDHRSEPLEAILDELEAGAREVGAEQHRLRRIADRRDAIAQAIAEARPGDLVLLAGKGHESTLERGSETLPWDEAAEARQHLGEKPNG